MKWDVNWNLSPNGLFAISHLKFARLWIALGILMIGTISTFSLMSVPDDLKTFLLNDKLMHVGVYACLMGWFTQIFRHDLTRLVLIALFIGMGIGIEYLQGMVPHRQFEILDMIANTCGVVLAWALAYTWVGSILEVVEKSIVGLFVSNAGPAG